MDRSRCSSRVPLKMRKDKIYDISMNYYLTNDCPTMDDYTRI